MKKTDSLKEAGIPRLYKYVGLERALKILEDNEIRMTQPQFLNDPFELSVKINPLIVQRNYYDFLVRETGRTSEDAWKSAKANIPDMVIDMVQNVISSRNEVGVLSLTKSPFNLLMWAHYADEHKGAVIEIDVDELAREPKREGEVQCLAEVIYQDKRIDILAEKIPPWSTLIYKSQSWSYEQEWRFIRSVDALQKKTETVYTIDVPSTAIRSIIFGARAFGPEEEQALDLLTKDERYQHVETRKALLSTDLAGLDTRMAEAFGGTILHGQHHFGENWREVRTWVDLDALEAAQNLEGPPEK